MITGRRRWQINKMIKKDYEVKLIDYKDTKDFILNKHYAQRMPSISWAFGLFHKETLIGVLTIGKPASAPLCKGIMNGKYQEKVYELNRLITLDGLNKNALSFFVSKSLKNLKERDLIIVSFADEGAGHLGYIYQATNFIYTGKTKERTDKYMPGNKHPRHYTEEYKHLRKVRTSKHRYVYFTKNKKLIKELAYPVLPYPKGENQNYILGQRIKTTIIDTKNGLIYQE